jgi:hypothetical protein
MIIPKIWIFNPSLGFNIKERRYSIMHGERFEGGKNRVEPGSSTKYDI